MKRAEFIAAYGAALVPTHDYLLLGFCRDATYGELADRHWNGDVGQVNNTQTFAGTYGFNNDEMRGFTVAVEARLNVLLQAAGRPPVRLPTEPGYVIPASKTVGYFVGKIYEYAK
jgi:hypothetical protein